MKKISLVILILVFMISCGGQQINETEFSEEAGDNILIGQVNLAGFKMSPFNEWFDEEYLAYQQNDSVLLTINKDDFINHVKITIVLGSWCSDSRREVPRFYKILEFMEFDLDNLSVICVNTNKTAEGTNVNQLDIQKVPTFIFYKEGLELGRIIETPKESLEKDMAEILK